MMPGSVFVASTKENTVRKGILRVNFQTSNVDFSKLSNRTGKNHSELNSRINVWFSMQYDNTTTVQVIKRRAAEVALERLDAQLEDEITNMMCFLVHGEDYCLIESPMVRIIAVKELQQLVAKGEIITIALASKKDLKKLPKLPKLEPIADLLDATQQQKQQQKQAAEVAAAAAGQQQQPRPPPAAAAVAGGGGDDSVAGGGGGVVVAPKPVRPQQPPKDDSNDAFSPQVQLHQPQSAHQQQQQQQGNEASPPLHRHHQQQQRSPPPQPHHQSSRMHPSDDGGLASQPTFVASLDLSEQQLHQLQQQQSGDQTAVDTTSVNVPKKRSRSASRIWRVSVVYFDPVRRFRARLAVSYQKDDTVFSVIQNCCDALNSSRPEGEEGGELTAEHMQLQYQKSDGTMRVFGHDQRMPVASNEEKTVFLVEDPNVMAARVQQQQQQQQSPPIRQSQPQQQQAEGKKGLSPPRGGGSSPSPLRYMLDTSGAAAVAASASPPATNANVNANGSGSGSALRSQGFMDHRLAEELRAAHRDADALQKRLVAARAAAAVATERAASVAAKRERLRALLTDCELLERDCQRIGGELLPLYERDLQQQRELTAALREKIVAEGVANTVM